MFELLLAFLTSLCPVCHKEMKPYLLYDSPAYYICPRDQHMVVIPTKKRYETTIGTTSYSRPLGAVRVTDDLDAVDTGNGIKAYPVPHR
jgi:hypothetical protein